MDNLKPVLILEPPNELRFLGPLEAPIVSYVTLTNPSEKDVLFRILLTAPDIYAVRPRSGLIPGNTNVQIAIISQQFLFKDKPANHKLLVRSLFVPEGEVNQQKLWKDTSPQQIRSYELSCVYVCASPSLEDNEEPLQVEKSQSEIEPEGLNIVKKSEQILTIKPRNELLFRGPLNAQITSYLTLTNPSEINVMFRLMTTVPNNYCVRPNSGVLLPHSSIKIAITAQSFPLETQVRHKFKLESLLVPDNLDTKVDLKQFWAEVNPGLVKTSVLICVFENENSFLEDGMETVKQFIVQNTLKCLMDTAINM